ncbi:hypothetical protein CIRMBP1310_01700 [Enterococcus cecorum]|uniref:hypothetical protein n=1 Tax=Enterococcus cecorum TaxID=44008 RepID=UPI000B0FA9CC|nr:hypothetical protein [Enterococcus cecorum]MCJ0535931.1 hypothetical protein [Enterococcus cecorum]MCJ0554968.1 hypothetical protein [Enterococcus cecorum]CAI3479521.1 hypothetical protein CIRMBP1310_01700 [Enterococcus cecorum]CAI3502757.1 hypothetical protein CIRMBP1311_02103 [Enterococcus cecorum]
MELRTQVKKINLTSKENSLVLEISDEKLGEKLPELKKFIGEFINIQIIPEIYSYQVEIDEDGHPIVSWQLLQDGSVEIERSEQLSLLEQTRTRKEMLKVQRATVDEFIALCPVIKHINDINPKDVLDRLKQGEDFSSVADDYGLSDSGLVAQLDEVREYYLPVADAWVKNDHKFEFADEYKNNDNSNDGEN